MELIQRLGRVKARKVRAATRRFRDRLRDYHHGAISFAEFDATVRGWVNHVSQADSLGLRSRVLRDVVLQPARRSAALGVQKNRGRR